MAALVDCGKRPAKRRLCFSGVLSQALQRFLLTVQVQTFAYFIPTTPIATRK